MSNSLRRTVAWLRALRWVAIATAVTFLWACADHKLEAPHPAPTQVTTNHYQEALNKDLDILFMVDDSPSMDVLQDKLADQFPAFMQVLQGLPNGLPNVHIAVITQDLGAGGIDLRLQGCPLGGDQGQFKFEVGPNGKMKGANGALVPCTSTGLMPGQTFISDIEGPNATRIKNYTGNIADVFGCIAGTGDKGCGFETPLAAVSRALGVDGQGPPPATNAGFLRPGAYLAVVYITNEDDGSVSPDSGLYSPSDPSLSPFDNFRAQEYGTLCDGAPPPLNVPMNWPTGACQPNPSGGLIPVETLVAQLESVKSDPSQILVAAIAGPPDPYGTHLEDVPGGSAQSIFVNHSCTAPDKSNGDPGIRMFSFINEMGGVFEKICADSFAPALVQIAAAIGKVLGPACVHGPVADKDPATPGAQYDCSVVEHQYQTDGTPRDTVVPSCDDPHQGKCWSLISDPAKCSGPNDLFLAFTPPPDPSVSNLTASVSCSTCIAGQADPRCP